MKTINKIYDWFSKPGLGIKLFLGCLGLLLVINVVGLLSTMTTGSEQQSPSITATYKGADSVALRTWTPTPAATGSPKPTQTPLPTGLPTESLDTATAVIIIPANRVPITRDLIVIANVDKRLEYVDIQNVSYSIVFLTGWVLVSETGHQSCLLKGSLKSKEVLRIYAGTARPGQVGISCGFHNPIWLDQESDPAVLYNSNGEEVSRYP